MERSGPSIYRLRGEVAGVERTFDLPLGEYSVGQAKTNDLCLPVRGVSRQHAVLLVGPTGLVAEDRRSTNGTFVDDHRVERAVAASGAELRFGPVRFQVEVLAEEDAVLAIDLAAAAEEVTPPLTSPSLTLADTTRLTLADKDLEEIDSGILRTWLAVIEGFNARLAPPGDLEQALAFLVETLGARGGCAACWSAADEPTALAAWAEVHDIPSPQAVRDLRRGSPQPGSAEVRTAHLETEPCTSLAVRFSGNDEPGNDEPLGLLVWGDFGGRRESAYLLRILVTLLEPFRPRALHRFAAATAPARPARLVFPDGYRMGTSAAMTALYRQMQRLLTADIAILVCGETGVGKELVARSLHASSTRNRRPFVAVNCSAIPADLLEAELFGVARAVATGVGERPGMFRLADGGTLFLDEIGEMALALQAKLLRALQEKEIRPVGGVPEAVDVRIVSATNADLAAQMDAGRFRRDLYYRLAEYTLEIPALRACRDDIPGLVKHFLARFTAQAGTRIRGITVKALRHLVAYPWPGNVRQLENEVRRLVYLATDGQVLDSGLLSPAVLETPASASALSGETEGLALEPRIRALEAELIREALRRSGGKPTHAARLLALSRNGLTKKMKRLGIER